MRLLQAGGTTCPSISGKVLSMRPARRPATKAPATNVSKASPSTAAAPRRNSAGADPGLRGRSRPSAAQTKIMAAQISSQRAMARSSRPARGRETMRDHRRAGPPLASGALPLPCSVQAERNLGVAQAVGMEQRCLRYLHRMQPAVDFPPPEGEKAAQHRIARRDVELLPDEALQQIWVIGQVIEDFGRGQAIAFQLQFDGRHREPLVAVAPAASCQQRSRLREFHQEKTNYNKGLAAYSSQCC